MLRKRGEAAPAVLISLWAGTVVKEQHIEGRYTSQAKERFEWYSGP